MAARDENADAIIHALVVALGDMTNQVCYLAPETFDDADHAASFQEGIKHAAVLKQGSEYLER
jgi:hypothetical protein